MRDRSHAQKIHSSDCRNITFTLTNRQTKTEKVFLPKIKTPAPSVNVYSVMLYLIVPRIFPNVNISANKIKLRKNLFTSKLLLKTNRDNSFEHNASYFCGENCGSESNLSTPFSMSLFGEKGAFGELMQAHLAEKKISSFPPLKFSPEKARAPRRSAAEYNP